MSERMIELQRAKILAQQQQSQPQINGNAAAHGPRPSSQRVEDRELGIFLRRLQEERDEGQRAEAAGVGPTVPTALSRRMLHRQGVGFLDSAVAAVASASADRFLVTVLQQSIACRDQRLKGTELAREAAKKRKLHLKQNQKDADDRKRRREEAQANRETEQLAAIRAMEGVSKAAASPSDTAKRKEPPDTDSGPRSKKRKKTGTSDATANGHSQAADDEDASYDSLDDEVDKYHAHYDDNDESDEASDVDDDDEYMILRDIARPLEAWEFYFRGKLEGDPLGFGAQVDDTIELAGEVEDLTAQDEVIVIDDIEDESNNNNVTTSNADDTKPSAAVSTAQPTPTNVATT